MHKCIYMTVGLHANCAQKNFPLTHFLSFLLTLSTVVFKNFPGPLSALPFGGALAWQVPELGTFGIFEFFNNKK